ncbi:hypothetical protein QYE76_062325 [Lolium multiflorum]|uniref:F-box domain-containing protein n=1 Tax=Lolium multiflorum TaxID=4521 RepID=A0AAD8S529_LOLMU|nr:hypothetical protein QYE76_062325 [Lolium multiflorum]
MGRRRSPRLHPQIHASEQGAGMARRRSPRLHPQIHASEDGVRMTRRIRRRRGKSPAEPASLPDDDDILREILVRLPPLPSSLPRASAVCKRWRGLVTDPRFLRQLYAHHRKPPLLGVFSRRKHLGNEFQFNPILDPPDRIPPRRFNLGRCSSHNGYNFLDSRHGLVLVEIRFLKGVVVWDPISSEQRRLAIPPTNYLVNPLSVFTPRRLAYGAISSSRRLFVRFVDNVRSSLAIAFTGCAAAIAYLSLIWVSTA